MFVLHVGKVRKILATYWKNLENLGYLMRIRKKNQQVQVKIFQSNTYKPYLDWTFVKLCGTLTDT